ncbi:hypothetical protein JCM10914A_42710 [Paenibacillus sp. JCM 10914]|uniref:RNA polymerase sigma factor n=1 Tax=Paenibacillus sp. JCM 10914 TaxID=1236974 RepID=UPI0003CCB6CE|nr:sigma-70 family RNA polymerase sigma factor [Paenibacillus sp. JCM 10914]GAE05490.1 probable sigma-70 factor, ECF subfamily protein [Paenibacillus sp. JCM 10914]
MSRAHDKLPEYPDAQGTIHDFEHTYHHYRMRIRHYFALKVNEAAAEDLTQQVFLKAMENLHRFRGKSSLFTWIFRIAQNVMKNEYRSNSRKSETTYDFMEYETQSISVDFARYIDIRIDISVAMQQLSELDQQIISLRFFADCTLNEVSKIVGMRESAVKNRLYRALEKLRVNLKEWGALAMKSIQDLVTIESKNITEDQHSQVHRDILNELKNNVEQLAAKYNHKPSKITIEIYPDLPAFHQAVGEDDAPSWFMGTYSNNTLQIVSPLSPGPEHTYHSILRSTLHLYAMWLVNDINPNAPKWLCQGIGGYEAQQMTPDFIRNTTADAIKSGSVPTLQELNDDSWQFGEQGFQFAYLLTAYILEQYGLESLNKLIRRPDDFTGIFQCTETEFHARWVKALSNKYS